MTTAEVLEVVRASLAEVNARGLRRDRARARSALFGDEIGLQRDPGRGARARRRSDALGAGGDRGGARGRPHPRRRAAGGRPAGRALNVNADEAAAALAVGLGAERIVFVSDVPGVLMDGDVVEHIARRRRRPDARRRDLRGRHRPQARTPPSSPPGGGVRAEIGATEVVA